MKIGMNSMISIKSSFDSLLEQNTELPSPTCITTFPTKSTCRGKRNINLTFFVNKKRCIKYYFMPRPKNYVSWTPPASLSTPTYKKIHCISSITLKNHLNIVNFLYHWAIIAAVSLFICFRRHTKCLKCLKITRIHFFKK